MSELREQETARDQPAGGADREVADAVRKARGQWRDEVWRRDPATGEVRLVEADDWDPNLIVSTFTNLLAGLLANEGTFLGGILQHAQGSGDSSWDVQLPNPSFDQTTLVAEYFRKAPDSITFVDENGDPVAAGVITNSILIRTDYDFDEANGPGGTGEFIREQGLFGGTATGAADSGLMVNAINHKARFKDDTVKIIRFIQLIF
ncbi:MAG TPA: hypothetical protein VMZ50_12970 [Phycisphaerae bacterium]|nr:hypothetical protein [Phycisphaerae bacterium]